MTQGQFWIYVLSVLLSPLLAVQATMWLQRKRAKRERQLDVFKTLMRTRASTLAPDHVQALNMVDVEFYGAKKGDPVLRAWKAYVNHLNTAGATLEIWGTRREELFIELLDAMARYLGFDFDKTEIRNTSYFPVGYGDREFEAQRIRTGLADIIDQKRTLPVTVYSPPPPPAKPSGE
jgi:Family of unknown function (DUF6680)